MSLLSETAASVLSCSILSTQSLSSVNVTAASVVGGEVMGQSITGDTVSTPSLVLNKRNIEVVSPLMTVSSGGDILSSPPAGNFFTTVNNTLFKIANDVAGNQFIWIAVGQKNSLGVGATMAISGDGVNWTAHPSPPPGDTITAIAFANNLWVCSVATHGMFYSHDGITWTVGSGTQLSFAKSIVYAQNLWVAVGSNVGSKQVYSTDGINWVAGTGSTFDFSGFSVAATDNLFVAVGYSNGSNLLVSEDGKSWTVPTTGPTFTFGYSVAVNPDQGLWVVVGEGQNMYTSSDGLVWTQITYNDIRATSLAWSGGKFIAIGNPKIGGTANQATSVNGVLWTTNPLPVTYTGGGTAQNTKANALRSVVTAV